MQTQDEALSALTRSWPTIVEECRSVLASELHYQAVVYRCLREVGGVPPTQVGMNVKMWIPDVVSDHFKSLDLKKAEDFRGGFEPIPDVVVFHSDIRGDFRRRNYSNTLRQMLMAIEIKASERDHKRLGPKEIVDDILKLDAHRFEARNRGTDFLPAVLVIDTAPELAERMTQYALETAKSAAKERGVCFFYLSQEEELRIVPDTTSPTFRATHISD